MSNSTQKGLEIPSKPFAFIWFALRPYRKWFFWALFFVILAEILGGTLAYVFKGFIDSANSYTQAGDGSLRTVFFWTIAYPIVNLLAMAAWRANGFMMNFLTVHVRTHASKILFEFLSLHSLSYFNNRFSGALSEKIVSTSAGVSRLITQLNGSILGLFVNLIVSGFIMSTASTTLALVYVGGFILLVPFNLLLTRNQNILSHKVAELSAKLRGQVIDIVTNIMAVQQYARRDYEIFRLDKAIVDYRDADVVSDNYREKVLLINNILISVFVGGIIIWAFVIWSRELITIGSLVMIVTLTNRFLYSLTYIGQNLNSVMEIYGEMRNGLNDIIRPHEISDKIGSRGLKVNEAIVAFENVTFSYDKDTRLVFEDLSLEVKAGQKVGIVGTSGAGKSTLMKLLLRQHDLLSGSIKIDGQDIREVTQESLRENISIVPQEPMLFHRTIRENIMYGKLDATEEEMIEVAKKAQAHDFIEALPQKYDSLVGERGVKLSVGQRQRIAIARAFLKNAPILILDEATSALDSESEVAVQKALQALMEGKTVFAIAHRLSTLREMDRILVFKNGGIAEDGSHRTLLRNKEGVYASLWNHQAGGFIKEE